jgi:hypothetical protein
MSAARNIPHHHKAQGGLDSVLDIISGRSFSDHSYESGPEADKQFIIEDPEENDSCSQTSR